MLKLFRNYGKYIVILLFAIYLIAKFFPGLVTHKSQKFNFIKFLNLGNQIYQSDSLIYTFKVDKDKLYFVYRDNKYNIDVLNATIDRDTVDEKNIYSISKYIIPFLNRTTAECKIDNFNFLATISMQFERILSPEEYISYLNNFINFSKNNDLSFLIEPLAIIKSQNYSYRDKYFKAYLIDKNYYQNWLQYEFFQQSFLKILWQIGKFDEIQQVVNNKDVSSNLRTYYTEKIQSLKNSNSPNKTDKLSGFNKFSIFLIIFILTLVLIFKFKDIYDYFKILYFNKLPDDEKRRRLQNKLFSTTNTDLVCPTCGKGIEDAMIISNQRGHNEFYVCAEHYEILVPVHTCSNCGSKLDKYSNCHVCSFNQKGELNLIFSFDLFSSLIICIYLVISIIALLYQFIPSAFNLELKYLKIIALSTLLLGLIVALLPFILKDLNIKILKPFYRFERYYFVSINKFVSLILISVLIDLIVPLNTLYSNQYFISFFNLFIIIAYIYGVYKYFSFGQDHKSYYENAVTSYFKGGLYVIMLLLFSHVIRDFPYFIKHISSFFSDIFVVITFNKLVFVFFILAILINDRRISKKGNRMDSLTLIVQDNIETIVSIFSVLLFLTYILLLKWFFSQNFINIHIIFIELLYLGAYYFILARQKSKNYFNRQKAHKSLITFEHNFYILVYVTLLFLINLTMFVNIIYAHTDINNLKGLINVFGYIIKYQLLSIIDFYNSNNVEFLFIGILSLVLFVVILILIAKKIASIFKFISPKHYVNIFEAERVKLLFKHLESLTRYINNLGAVKYIGEKEYLETRLYEQKYLVETYESQDINLKKNLTIPILNILESRDVNKIQQRFKAYSKKVSDFKGDIYLPNIFEDISLDTVNFTQSFYEAENFKLIFIWEEHLRKEIIKKNNKYLQLSERIWINSFRLLHTALTRFYHQMKSNYYSDEQSMQPYSTSPFNYFAVVYSEYAYLPASIEKLIAMKWNKKSTKDFVYIYFCDNFPQIKTAEFLSLSEDKRILDNADIDEISKYRFRVNSLLTEFDTFKAEISSYGYKCEFSPLNATIKVENFIRTQFDDSEKITASEGMIRVKETPEYYQSKFVLIVERLSFEQISELDEIEDKFIVIEAADDN